VISTGECLNYFFDEKNREKRLEKLFNQVYKALQLGGLFIFDILEPKIENPRKYNKIIEHEDWTMFYDIKENHHTNILNREIILFRDVGDNLYRKTKEMHIQKLYTRKQIISLLEKAGFDVLTFERYGNFELGSGHIGFLCKKSK